MRKGPSDGRIFEIHAALCQTLANATRLKILDILRDGERSVSDLIRLTGLSQANVSQHLAILRERKVLVTRREGQSVYYRIANPKIIKACDLIREALLEQLAESKVLARRVAKIAR